MHAKALQEKNPIIRAEFENLALGYLRLAGQADRNAKTDVVYEPPPEKRLRTPPVVEPQNPPASSRYQPSPKADP